MGGLDWSTTQGEFTVQTISFAYHSKYTMLFVTFLTIELLVAVARVYNARLIRRIGCPCYFCLFLCYMMQCVLQGHVMFRCLRLFRVRYNLCVLLLLLLLLLPFVPRGACP